MSLDGWSRRSLLGVGLASSAAALVAGCAPARNLGSQPSSPTAPVAAKPAHIPFDGPKPDLAGDTAIGVPNGYLSYPDPAPSTGRVPLKLSAPVEFMVQSTPSATPRTRNERWKAVERDLGTELRVTGADSTQYTAKFQTAVGGDTLSEITQVPAVPQLPQVLERMFTDLTPYLSGDNIQKYPSLANLPSATWDMCMVNGRIWGLTNARIVAGTVLMTRGDLLEARGIPQMPTLASGEDFLDLCTELTDRSQGVFAIGQVPQNWTLPVILESLGAPNGWRVDNGQWTSAYEDPAYERALEIVTTMWSSGVIHPNSFTDLSSTQSWFEVGTTALFAQNFASWVAQWSLKPFPVGVVKMPKWDGGGLAPKHLGAPGYADFVGLRKTNDEHRIDELLRVADYLASPFGTAEYLSLWYGVEGRQYTLSNHQVSLIPDAPNETVSGLSYFGGTSAINLYSPSAPDRARVWFDYCRDVIPDGVKNPSIGRFSDTKVTKGAVADRKLNDLMSDIIQGRTSLSQWAPAVRRWKTDAGDAIAHELAAQ